MALPDPPSQWGLGWWQGWGRSLIQQVGRRLDIIERDTLQSVRHQTKRSVHAGISAAGTSQATATLILGDICSITSMGSGTADGVRAPPCFAGMRVSGVNWGTGTVRLYPGTGDRIDTAGTNASINVAPNKAFLLQAPEDRRWFSILGA